MFVLSVMGVQSSGKSTMLNTMFGIRMRTSVGQCTRGVNMQLLAVEGRPKYDYILLLDTDGTRAPEYHGLPGSEKRDNQMATLSILLSDATIIIIPGENDAAVKEILPIVLMAYDGTKLAERNGSRLSSRMFFSLQQD
jgi:GTPase Era involved in 16S rRNA processing